MNVFFTLSAAHTSTLTSQFIDLSYKSWMSIITQAKSQNITFTTSKTFHQAERALLERPEKVRLDMHGNHEIMGNYFYTKYSFMQNNIMYQTQDRVKQTARQTDERRAITTIHAYYSQICVNSIKYFWQTGCSIIVNRDASLSQIPDTFDDYFRNTLKVRVIYCLPRHWPCIFGAVWTTISFLII